MYKKLQGEFETWMTLVKDSQEGHQGRSENGIFARAQIGQHIRAEARSFRSPPRKTLEFRTSEVASAGFSGQLSVAKIIHISSIQEALSLLFSLFLLSIAC